MCLTPLPPVSQHHPPQDGGSTRTLAGNVPSQVLTPPPLLKRREFCLTGMESHFLRQLDQQEISDWGYKQHPQVSLLLSYDKLVLEGPEEAVAGVMVRENLAKLLEEVHGLHEETLSLPPYPGAEEEIRAMSFDHRLLLRFKEQENGGEQLSVCALNSQHQEMMAFLQLVKEWIEAKSTKQCSICSLTYSAQELVVCSKSTHSFCAKSCLPHLVDVLLSNLRDDSSEGIIDCPYCFGVSADGVVDLQRVATICTKDISYKVNLALVNHRVKRYQVAQAETLRANIEQLHRQYEQGRGSTFALVDRAKEWVPQIHGQVLSLRCPNCFVTFDEGDFDGCMSIKCKLCGQDYCAWCYEGCRDAQTCNQHVLDCDWNLTQPRGIWASVHQLREGQKEHRRRNLRHHLREHSDPDLRNAIVMEMQNELLTTWGLDPVNFFEFLL